jgi:hypothetical protein
MNSPCIIICLASVRNDINAILAAMGRGPDSLTRKLCAKSPSATWQTAATHYFSQDMNATDEDEAIYKAMAENNDLPPISGVWGVGGVISAAAAQAAISSGNMQVYSAAGLTSSTLRDQWRDGVLLGASLQFVPDEPI